MGEGDVMRVYVIIAHAGWDKSRAASLERLLQQRIRSEFLWEAVTSAGPEHPAIWARRVWQEAAHAQHWDKGHVVVLNDDVILAEDFSERIHRAIDALPDECISLHCTNPHANALASPWVRCYHYSGPGVILPPGAAQSLLDYTYKLPWSLLSRTNEDNIAMMWAWDRQRPFWYLQPSPIAHDVTIPSTIGHDAHPNRGSAVPHLPTSNADLTIANKDHVPFVEIDWCLTAGLNYRRHVLRAGRHLCTLCVGREGVIGDQKQGVVLCPECLSTLTTAAITRTT